MSEKGLAITTDDLGDILVPPEVCERIHLAPGDAIVAEKNAEGGVRIRKLPEETSLVERNGFLVSTAKPTEDFGDIVREEREMRLEALIRGMGS